MKPQHIKMSNQRQVSTFAIVLLMASLVIGVWLSAPTCYATDPAPPYNETEVEERLDNIEKMLEEMRGVIYEIKYGLFGARVIKTPITPEPITNETDVIILPEPVTNETDVVIIVTDPLEELNLRIDYLDTSLQDLTEELFILQADYGAHLGLYNEIIEDLYSKIDTLTKANQKIGYLENDIQTLIFKQSKLQTNFFRIAIVTAVTAVTVILCLFLLIRKKS